MTTEEIKKMLIRYSAGQCTDLEKTIIEGTFMQFNEGKADLSQKRIEEISQEILQQLPESGDTKRIIKLWLVISAVACMGLIVIGILIFYPGNKTATRQNNAVHDIAPEATKPPSF